MKRNKSLSNGEEQVGILKIDNANLRSQLEDALEKIEFYKIRIRKVRNNGSIHKFNMFGMLNPYENSRSTPVPLTSVIIPKGNTNVISHTEEEAKTFSSPLLINDASNKRMGDWAKTYLPLIQKGDRSNKIIQRAVFEGIPNKLREVIWYQLIGNIHQDYSSLYNQLLDLREIIQDTEIYRKSEKLIDKDLHRTFTTLDLFKPGNMLHKPLRNILTAFIVHRPDIGYVQGMSYLAGVLLMNLEETKAFTLFITLTNWDILYYCFCFKMDKVNGFFSVFSSLIKEYTPDVYNILQEENIAVSLFLFEWIITMFSSTFSTTTGFRIWDQILLNGQIEIIKFSIAILKCIEDVLVSEENHSYEKYIQMLKNPSKFVAEDDLFDCYFSIKLDRVQSLKDILGS